MYVFSFAYNSFLNLFVVFILIVVFKWLHFIVVTFIDFYCIVQSIDCHFIDLLTEYIRLRYSFVREKIYNRQLKDITTINPLKPVLFHSQQWKTCTWNQFILNDNFFIIVSRSLSHQLKIAVPFNITGVKKSMKLNKYNFEPICFKALKPNSAILTTQHYS